MPPYSIGCPTSPREDDPRFDDLDEAIAAAVTHSYDDGVWAVAVWEDDSGELLALVYQQQVFYA